MDAPGPRALVLILDQQLTFFAALVHATMVDRTIGGSPTGEGGKLWFFTLTLFLLSLLAIVLFKKLIDTVIGLLYSVVGDKAVVGDLLHKSNMGTAFITEVGQVAYSQDLHCSIRIVLFLSIHIERATRGECLDFCEVMCSRTSKYREAFR